MATKLHVFGISGSLRRGSFNTALIRAAIELAPEGMDIELADISGLPPYNEDVNASGQPPAVVDFRRRIAAADALLFSTPEYNYSMSGVLKNAIDWASRPPAQPFDGKPIAIMGASAGPGGTIRAQYHLRQSAVYLNMLPLNKPECFVARAHEKFDKDGKLVDEATRKAVGQLLVSLAAWVARLRNS